MTDSIEAPVADDELSRQRRKRESRLLEQQVADFPTLTLADVVADVLAASNGGSEAFDVHGYLAVQGYDGRTIEAVVGYLHRQFVPEAPASSQLPSL